jgi:phage repressor protein C with HTH and peptisase S24 domain
MTSGKRRGEMTHEEIWKAIERFATEHKMSCSGLAKCSGMDATTFNKSKRWSKEGKPRWPSTRSLSKILSSTGVQIEEFTKYLQPSEFKVREVD